jgi:hypothetical protein
MLTPLHRILLPCINGLDSVRQYSSSSSQQWPDRQADVPQQLQPIDPATRQLVPQVIQLTKEQKQELKQVVVGR